MARRPRHQIHPRNPRIALERLPFERNRSNDRKSLKIKKLEQALKRKSPSTFLRACSRNRTPPGGKGFPGLNHRAPAAAAPGAGPNPSRLMARNGGSLRRRSFRRNLAPRSGRLNIAHHDHGRHRDRHMDSLF
jgi:hypothetical protein